MIDLFLLLTPILLLLVILLFGFVGCSFQHGGIAPSPPSLTAVAGDTTVTLTWTPDTGDPPVTYKKYNVNRGTQTGNLSQIATVDAPATTFIDTSLADGTTYYYTVQGVYQYSGATGDFQTGESKQVDVTPAAVPGRPPGSVLDPTSPFSTNLIGLFLMNEGTGTMDMNLVDSKSATFSGPVLPTWEPADPSIVFHGGGSLTCYLDGDETGSLSSPSEFDLLPISQVTVVAKVYFNTLGPGGVCEKNDNNQIDSGFIFGWDANGSLGLAVEKDQADMRALTTSSVVPVGQWVQVAFTWDGTVGTADAAHLFVNGLEQAKAVAQDGAGTIGYKNAIGQPFRIGNASFNAQGVQIMGSLYGKMAYLAVYKSRILTPGEMSQFDATLPIQPGS